MIIVNKKHMSKTILLLTGLSLLIMNCTKQDILKGTPACIEKKINEIANGQVWDPPAKVYSYEYNGQTVYYFTARCCDIMSILYDENCTLICSPDGGIAGNGDGKCSDFFSTKTNEQLIWEDKRN